jgi:hypothetical protein
MRGRLQGSMSANGNKTVAILGVPFQSGWLEVKVVMSRTWESLSFTPGFSRVYVQRRCGNRLNGFRMFHEREHPAEAGCE